MKRKLSPPQDAAAPQGKKQKTSKHSVSGVQGIHGGNKKHGVGVQQSLVRARRIKGEARRRIKEAENEESNQAEVEEKGEAVAAVDAVALDGLEDGGVKFEEEEKKDVVDLPVSTDLYSFEESAICKDALREQRWTNRQRTLVLSTRGITYRQRHLIDDIKKMLPHSKSEPKWEKKDVLSELNEICEMQS